MLKSPYHCVFTGIDEYTDINELLRVSKSTSKVSFGVLYSEDRSGKPEHPRYPSVQYINSLICGYNLVNRLKPSLHLCGKISFDILNGKYVKFPFNIHAFSNIQLNASCLTHEQIENAKKFGLKYSIPIILQTRDQEVFPSNNDLTWLFDISGGRGKVADKFPKLTSSTGRFGYAGGFTPENVVEQLFKIDNPNQYLYYIDVESGVRTDDRFDVEKCFKLLKEVYGG